MDHHSRPELAASALFGASLLLLALWLHDVQPGYWVPPAYGLGAVVVVYAALALLLEGLTLRALGLFALTLAVHAAFGALMGAVLAPRGDIAGPDTLPTLLRAATCEPYALALQAAFVVPVTGWALWPLVAPGRREYGEALTRLGEAQDAEALLHELAAAQAQVPADLLLARTTARAAELLAGERADEQDAGQEAIEAESSDESPEEEQSDEQGPPEVGAGEAVEEDQGTDAGDEGAGPLPV